MKINRMTRISPIPAMDLPMLLRIAFIVILGFGRAQSARADVVRIADGDCSGLGSAVAAAKASASPTTIFLARNGAYGSTTFPGCNISMDVGNVVIEGQGASLRASICVGIPLAPDYNFSHNASLRLRNVSLIVPANYTQCDDGGSFGTFGAFAAGVTILNHGSLALESVNVVAQSNPAQTDFSDGFLYSDGDLVLRNVTVAGFHQYVPNLSGAPPAGSILTSSGSLEIYNSTFADSSAVVGFDWRGRIPPNSPAPLITAYGHLKIANTLFAGNNTSQSCDTPASSLGGNVASESSCGFSAGSGDRIVADAGLGNFGNHGGLVPTQAIDGGSPARGAGVAQYCEAVDARGYTRSPHGCDAGAYEYGGGSGALTASGLNGFYYDPDANGHYVSLQRIHDNGDIAIVWSTFDSNGNQAWVYGVGQLAGKRIHAAMSQNLGGVLQPGGAPTGSSVHPWGTVDIDLTSCALAQFSYASAVQGFGSGAFPLTRLAFVSDFGCSD